MMQKRGRPNRPFEDDYRKDSKTQNVFRKRKDMRLSKDIESERRENLILWNTFFRRNPHRFVEMYMGVKLFPYQILWLYLMSISDVFVAICSRAAAKSFLVAVFSIAQCILYPNSEVVIGASTIKQAGLIISEKVQFLRNQSAMLQREIISVTTNINSYEALFANGSKMKVVAANEGGKGNRATFLVLDEFRLLKKEIVDEIFTPFLYVRQVPFKQLPEFADYPEEEPRKFSISSAGYKSEWWFKDAISTVKLMVDGKKAGFFCTDYLISILHKIKTKKQMETEKEQSDPISFAMEYENVPMGQSGKAYFKSQMFPRSIKGAFYPLRDDMLTQKKNPYGIPKLPGEIRVISLDVASRANKMNDNSITVCARLIPTHKGYNRKIVFIESSHGSNIISQALRIKEVYFDFGADYLVLDLQQVGISIFDSMSSISVNPERGIEYPAFTVMESLYVDEKVRDELRERTLGINASPVVFPISANSKLNSDIAVAFRGALQKKLFDFLATDIDAEDYLIKTNKEFINTDEELAIRAWLLHPYVQTNLLVGECLNLEMSILNGTIKLDEGSGLKDRYTSVSYLNYFVSTVLDRELLRQGDDMTDEQAMLAVTMVM
jgi:hypothetical protein